MSNRSVSSTTTNNNNSNNDHQKKLSTARLVPNLPVGGGSSNIGTGGAPATTTYGRSHAPPANSYSALAALQRKKASNSNSSGGNNSNNNSNNSGGSNQQSISIPSSSSSTSSTTYQPRSTATTSVTTSAERRTALPPPQSTNTNTGTSSYYQIESQRKLKSQHHPHNHNSSTLTNATTGVDESGVSSPMTTTTTTTTTATNTTTTAGHNSHLGDYSSLMNSVEFDHSSLMNSVVLDSSEHAPFPALSDELTGGTHSSGIGGSGGSGIGGGTAASNQLLHVHGASSPRSNVVRNIISATGSGYNRILSTDYESGHSPRGGGFISCWTSNLSKTNASSITLELKLNTAKNKNVLEDVIEIHVVPIRSGCPKKCLIETSPSIGGMKLFSMDWPFTPASAAKSKYNPQTTTIPLSKMSKYLTLTFSGAYDFASVHRIVHISVNQLSKTAVSPIRKISPKVINKTPTRASPPQLDKHSPPTGTPDSSLKPRVINFSTLPSSTVKTSPDKTRHQQQQPAPSQRRLQYPELYTIDFGEEIKKSVASTPQLAQRSDHEFFFNEEMAGEPSFEFNNNNRTSTTKMSSNKPPANKSRKPNPKTMMVQYPIPDDMDDEYNMSEKKPVVYQIDSSNSKARQAKDTTQPTQPTTTSSSVMWKQMRSPASVAKTPAVVVPPPTPMTTAEAPLKPMVVSQLRETNVYSPEKSLFETLSAKLREQEHLRNELEKIQQSFEQNANDDFTLPMHSPLPVMNPVSPFKPENRKVQASTVKERAPVTATPEITTPTAHGDYRQSPESASSISTNTKSPNISVDSLGSTSDIQSANDDGAMDGSPGDYSQNDDGVMDGDNGDNDATDHMNRSDSMENKESASHQQHTPRDQFTTDHNRHHTKNAINPQFNKSDAPRSTTTTTPTEKERSNYSPVFNSRSTPDHDFRENRPNVHSGSPKNMKAHNNRVSSPRRQHPTAATTTVLPDDVMMDDDELMMIASDFGRRLSKNSPVQDVKQSAAPTISSPRTQKTNKDNVRAISDGKDNILVVSGDQPEGISVYILRSPEAIRNQPPSKQLPSRIDSSTTFDMEDETFFEERKSILSELDTSRARELQEMEIQRTEELLMLELEKERLAKEKLDKHRELLRLQQMEIDREKDQLLMREQQLLEQKKRLEIERMQREEAYRKQAEDEALLDKHKVELERQKNLLAQQRELEEKRLEEERKRTEDQIREERERFRWEMERFEQMRREIEEEKAKIEEIRYNRKLEYDRFLQLQAQELERMKKERQREEKLLMKQKQNLIFLKEAVSPAPVSSAARNTSVSRSPFQGGAHDYSFQFSNSNSSTQTPATTLTETPEKNRSVEIQVSPGHDHHQIDTHNSPPAIFPIIMSPPPTPMAPLSTTDTNSMNMSNSNSHNNNSITSENKHHSILAPKVSTTMDASTSYSPRIFNAGDSFKLDRKNSDMKTSLNSIDQSPEASEKEFKQHHIPTRVNAEVQYHEMEAEENNIEIEDVDISMEEREEEQEVEEGEEQPLQNHDNQQQEQPFLSGKEDDDDDSITLSADEETDEELVLEDINDEDGDDYDHIGGTSRKNDDEAPNNNQYDDLPPLPELPTNVFLDLNMHNHSTNKNFRKQVELPELFLDGLNSYSIDNNDTMSNEEKRLQKERQKMMNDIEMYVMTDVSTPDIHEKLPSPISQRDFGGVSSPIPNNQSMMEEDVMDGDQSHDTQQQAQPVSNEIFLVKGDWDFVDRSVSRKSNMEVDTGVATVEQFLNQSIDIQEHLVQPYFSDSSDSLNMSDTSERNIHSHRGTRDYTDLKEELRLDDSKIDDAEMKTGARTIPEPVVMDNREDEMMPSAMQDVQGPKHNNEKKGMETVVAAPKEEAPVTYHPRKTPSAEEVIELMKPPKEIAEQPRTPQNRAPAEAFQSTREIESLVLSTPETPFTPVTPLTMTPSLTPMFVKKTQSSDEPPYPEHKLSAVQKQNMWALNFLRKGTTFSKFHKSKKKSDNRVLKLDSSCTTVLVQKTGFFNKSQKIGIQEIRWLVYGPYSSLFKKTLAVCPWRCFSIRTTKRTYDFVANTDTDVDVWILGLQSLIYKNIMEENRPLYTRGELLFKRLKLKLQLRAQMNNMRIQDLVFQAIERASKARAQPEDKEESQAPTTTKASRVSQLRLDLSQLPSPSIDE